ncbi:cysteine-rich receptor-like protein kinase 2-like protein, partial [Trifolium pratense]
MRRQQLNLLITTLIILSSSCSLTQADPQTCLINKGCSTYNATNLSNFYKNLKATLLDLQSKIGNENKHFATAQSARGADPVFALFQCRNYLSNSDCSACFAVAAAQIRNCSAGCNGARVIYDGCFL